MHAPVSVEALDGDHKLLQRQPDSVLSGWQVSMESLGSTVLGAYSSLPGVQLAGSTWQVVSVPPSIGSQVPCRVEVGGK
jgi:hypothetical protein